jgi:hypothetical protein
MADGFKINLGKLVDFNGDFTKEQILSKLGKHTRANENFIETIFDVASTCFEDLDVKKQDNKLDYDEFSLFDTNNDNFISDTELENFIDKQINKTTNSSKKADLSAIKESFESKEFDQNGNVKVTNNSGIFAANSSESSTTKDFYNSKGVKIRTEYRDSTGNLIQADIFNSDGKLAQTNKYNSKGKIIEKDKFDLEGKVTAVNKYNSNGIQTEKTRYDADGNVIETRKYSDGKVTEKTRYKDKIITDENDKSFRRKTTETVTYNASEKITQKYKKTILYDENNTATESSYIEKYDQTGKNLLEKTTYDSNGNIIEKTERTYGGKDGTGSLKESKKSYTDAAGNQVMEVKKYSSSRILLEKQVYINNVLKEIDKYDTKTGKIAIEKDEYSNGVIVKAEKYDSTGTVLTERDKYDSAGKILSAELLNSDKVITGHDYYGSDPDDAGYVPDGEHPIRYRYTSNDNGTITIRKSVYVNGAYVDRQETTVNSIPDFLRVT